MYRFNLSADYVGILFCVIGILVLGIWRKMLAESGKYMICLFLSNILVLSANAVGLLYKGRTEGYVHALLRASNFLEFAGGYLLSLCFSLYVFNRAKISAQRHALTWLLWAYYLLAMALLVISQFNGMYYFIDAQNVYHRSSLFGLSLLIGVGFLILNSLVLWIHRGEIDRGEKIALLLYILIPAAALALESFMYGLYLFRLATTASLVIMFILLLSIQVKRYYQNEADLANLRVTLTTSQLQPHFLYNSLTSIKYLCKDDPAAAAEAIDDFSQYLRGNMYALSAETPILFEQEMTHIRHYLSLEKLRFGERLRVETDLRATGFRVPALTVQPLVENAVRYGVTQREDGVTVKISSYRRDGGYCVQVEDDGGGFDVEHYRDDNRTHIGIDGVRSRLKAMCGGSLELQSRKGEGTVALICVPEEGAAAQCGKERAKR